MMNSNFFRARSHGMLISACFALIALTSCAPSTSLTLVPQAEAGTRVVQIPIRNRGALRVELRDGRSFVVPPGHFPPLGECRIWRPELPPGRQAPSGDCDELVTRVPPDAVLLRR